MPMEWMDGNIAKADAAGFIYSLLGRKRVLTCTLIAAMFAALALLAPRAAWAQLAIVCAAFSLLRGSYLLWAAERNRFARVCAYLSKPDINCAIELCLRCAGSEGVYLLVYVDVTNESLAITTLRSATLELRLNGRLYRSIIFPADLAAETQPTGTAASQLQTGSYASLLGDIADRPLEIGVHRSGALIFPFDALPELPATLRLRIALEDAYGNAHRVEQVLEARNGSWRKQTCAVSTAL